MKILMIIALFLSANSFAMTGREAWKHANTSGKVFLLNEYREVLKSLQDELEDEKIQVRFLTSFLDEAWAAEFDCMYAGWPSKRINNKCSSPAKHNPDYKSSCGKNQMQCQPLLFGKGICVETATSQQKSLAFSNCEKKKKLSTEDLIREIKEDGKEGLLLELFDYADRVCSRGKQAGTGMCKRLAAAVDKMRHYKEADDRQSKKVTPPQTSPRKSGNEKKTADQDLVEAVKSVEHATEKINNPEDCDPEETGEDYARAEPRPGTTEYVTSRQGKDPVWDDTFTKVKEEEELRYTGFEFSSIGPNAIAGSPLDPAEKVERKWHFATEDNSRREAYLWITDDAGSGKLSQLMESLIVLVPRKMKPSVEVVGDELQVTLPTGEKVIYDKETRIIKGGVLKEGKVDLNPDRFSRKFAPIAYEGKGISIRVDKRGEDPRLLGVNATISQNGKSCKVPVTELWTSSPDFKYSDDAKLVEFLNRKCANKFKL